MVLGRLKMERARRYVRFAVSCMAAAAFAPILVASPARAQHRPFGYLIDTANETKRIEYSHAVVSADDNARIARMACDALTRLTKDHDLVVAGDEFLFRRIKADRSVAVALIENLTEFNAEFLPAEAELLRAQGLEYPALVDALRVASQMRPMANVKNLTPATIFSDVNLAQSQVCQFAKGAVSARQRAQTLWTFSGIVLAVADLGGAIAFVAGSWGVGMPAAGELLLTSTAVGTQVAIAGVTGTIP